MDIDAMFRNVRSVHQTVSGKTDSDVMLIFKGTGYGVTKPYTARIDASEGISETCEGALLELLDKLKKQLSEKVNFAEKEAERLRGALSQLDN